MDTLEKQRLFRAGYEAEIRALTEKAGGEYGCADDYFAALDADPVRGLRRNGLKIDADAFERLHFAPLAPTPFAPDGFVLRARGTHEDGARSIPPGLHPYHAAGLYYMQEPSAMICAAALAPLLPDGASVLDLCAAPGGKSAQLAAALDGRGVLVANETVFPRAKTLLGNVERLGIRNCTVTCRRPDELAAAWPGRFDAVVADVPCSGEGMLRKEKSAAENWSEKSVSACAARGREILASAVRLLKPGGYLAYSTCTLNEAENERQIAWLLESFDCRVVPVSGALRAACDRGLPPAREALRVFCHRAEGEGHFACILQKVSAGPQDTGAPLIREKQQKIPDAVRRAFDDFYDALTAQPLWAELTAENETLLIRPADCAQSGGIRPIRAGVAAAGYADGRPVPHHQLARALDPALVRAPLCYPALSGQIRAYLAGETFSVDDGVGGWRIVQADGYNLGFVKVSGGVAKNDYPKGLRFRVPPL